MNTNNNNNKAINNTMNRITVQKIIFAINLNVYNVSFICIQLFITFDY